MKDTIEKITSVVLMVVLFIGSIVGIYGLFTINWEEVTNHNPQEVLQMFSSFILFILSSMTFGGKSLEYLQLKEGETK